MTEKEFKQIIKPLPLRERERLNRKDISPAWLEEQITAAKQGMHNDLWIGIPWVLFYGFSLFTFGLTAGTVLIFCIGAVYFVYVTIKRGNYGLLKRKVKVFEELKERI